MDSEELWLKAKEDAEMRLMTPSWGPFLGVGKGVEPVRKALTQPPLLQVSLILILRS